jgi:penicillin amidase
MASIHADRVSLPSRLFAEVVERVTDWDGVMDPDSTGAAVYAVLREHLAEILLEREPLAKVAGNDFPDDPLPVPAQYRVRTALPRLIEQDERTVLGDSDWSNLFDEALERALDTIERQLGPDRSRWRWDHIHVTRARHPLSSQFPDAGLDPAPLGCGGDGETVQATGWQLGFGVDHVSVARYVFDVADWDGSAWAVPFGSSGDPASPHYADQAETWARVGLYPMTYSWDRIVAGAEARQSLEAAR